MFACVYNLFSVLFFALPLLASASVLPRTDGPSNQCNTGPIQCCNNVGTANALGLGSILSLLGIVLDPVTALIGINCSPLSVIGIGGNSCSATPVCCTGNTFNGLINLGCSPININL
ncbi:fungal hydrophobin-domain-containing protein [Panaeolus papilionaceus]|nr:fungal hydrophobin-domain-containing protein [Panaeolus papilionaceus]